MYCKNCGRALNMEEKFCPECGTPAVNSPAEKIEILHTVNAETKAEPAHVDKKPKQHDERKQDKDKVLDGIVWDVHEFPEPETKKTKDVNFDWGNTEEDFPEIFEEINEIPETPIPDKLEMDSEESESLGTGSEMVNDEVPVFDKNQTASEAKEIENQPEKEESASEIKSEPVLDIRENNTDDSDTKPEITFTTNEDSQKERFNPSEIVDKLEAEVDGKAGEMEKFYTFSEKNVEFQKMLDAELSKLKSGDTMNSVYGGTDEKNDGKFVTDKDLFSDDIDALFAEKGLSTEVPNTILTHDLKPNPEFEQKMAQMERQDRDKEILDEQIAAQKEARETSRQNEEAGESDIPKPFETTAFSITDNTSNNNRNNNSRSGIDPGLFKFDTLPDLVPISSLDEEMNDNENVPESGKTEIPAETVINDSMANAAVEPTPAAETFVEQTPVMQAAADTVSNEQTSVEQTSVEQTPVGEGSVREDASQRKFDFSALEVIFNENGNAENNDETVLNFEDLESGETSLTAKEAETPKQEKAPEKTYEIPENLLNTDIAEDDEQKTAGADHIKEMHEARATFFGQTDLAFGNEPPEFDWGAATVVLDKKSIKEALAEASQEIEESHEQEAVVENSFIEVLPEQNPNSFTQTEHGYQPAFNDATANEYPVENTVYAVNNQDGISDMMTDKSPNTLVDENSEYNEPKKKGKGGTVLKIIIIILAVILVAELVIIAIKYFSDTSPAAKWIDVQAVKLIKWLNSVF